MNLWTGHRVFLARTRQRAGDFQAFLRLVPDHYRGWHVALLLDANPSHTAAGSTRLAAHLGVEFLWLPKRSPQLNPLESLWGEAKDVIGANRQYATIDQQVQRFITYLMAFTDDAALATSGLLSGNFWLRKTLCKKFC